MKGMLEGIRKGTGADVSFSWVDYQFLVDQGVKEGQFPLYAPPTGETAGFHRCNIKRALAKGLKFRPVHQTAKDTLEWYKSLPADIQARVAPQFAKRSNEEDWLSREKSLLQLWKERA